MRKIFLFLIISVFVCCLFLFRHHFSIFYFQNDIGKVAINIEAPKNNDIYSCFDKNCDLMKFNNDVYSYELNQNNPMFYNGAFNDIEFIFPDKNYKDKIKSISVFYGLDKIFYLSKDDINKIQIEDVDFQNQKMFSLGFKINQANNKTILQKTAVYLEGIFYNWYFYLAFYILLLVYFFKYQSRFEFKIKYGIIWILFLALLLRLSHIDYIPLWNDELYTYCFISNLGNGFNLNRAFLDPGNPPLFFLISNIWLVFFNKTIFSIRMLPCLIGLFQVYSTYYVADKIFNKKIALISAFLSSINIIFILESNEIRSYILSMTLVLWGVYWFYKLKSGFSKKNLIIYSLIAILLINTHYYCILFILANFIIGLFLFKNKRIKFLLSQGLVFLTFLPYFLITFVKFSTNPYFNTWLEKPTIASIYYHIVFYFGNLFWFLLVVLFSIFIYKKMLKNEQKFFIYNIFIVAFVFIFAFLISIFIKPILFERYFIIFMPFLIINTAIFLNIDFKTKFKPIILCFIFLISINIPKYENFNLFSNINSMANYSLRDCKQYDNQYKIYFVVPDKVEYAKYYKNIPFENIIVSQFGVREDIDLLKEYKTQIDYKKGQKVIFYLPEICINSKIKYSKEPNIKRIKTTIVPVYKIVLE